MIICEQCGSKLEDDSTRCVICGAEVVPEAQVGNQEIFDEGWEKIPHPENTDAYEDPSSSFFAEESATQHVDDDTPITDGMLEIPHPSDDSDASEAAERIYLVKDEIDDAEAGDVPELKDTPTATDLDGSSEEWSDAAINLVQEKDFDNAFEAFGKSLELDPDNAETLFRLGGAYYRQGAFALAARAFELSRQRDPKHPRAQFWHEQAFMQARGPQPDVPDLLTAYKKAAQVDAEEEISEPGQAANPIRRLIALVIDLLFMICCYSIVCSIAAKVAGMFGMDSASLMKSDSYYFLTTPVIFFFFMGYFNLCLAGVGQTVGMWILKIRLENAKGKPPGLFVCSVRSLVFWFGIFFVIVALPVTLKRGLHDIICRTYVVQDS
jgi:uncharacterized RDD family membrane protein YckC